MFSKPLIIFDGICNLCNSSVDFILKKDKRQYFFFATYQSDVIKRELSNLGVFTDEIKTVYLFENRKLYSKSTAVLQILKNLSFPWNLFYNFIFIPEVIRDFFYDIIARNRYRWFGKRVFCRIPNKEIKNRFLV